MPDSRLHRLWGEASDALQQLADQLKIEGHDMAADEVRDLEEALRAERSLLAAMRDA